MNLKTKTDQILVMDLKGLVTRERETLTKILHYLKEVQTRQLYLARGYPSLFAWLVQDLGYSEAAAQRRISAMRLMKEIPELEKDLQSGAVSLSVVNQVQTYFRKENKQRKAERKAPLPKHEKIALLEQVKGSSARECEQKLIAICPEVNLPKDKARALTEELSLVQFKADQKLMKKIERLQQLLSHQVLDGEYGPVFAKAIDIALDKLDPERRQARREQKAKTHPLPTSTMKTQPEAKPRTAKPSRTRHIPTPLRDQIWQRDRGRCQYRDPQTGKHCGSRHGLEIDHRQPFAWGGKHQASNLRLMCRAHNQFRAQAVFGKRIHPTADVGSAGKTLGEAG